jgi:cytidine deaminase
MSAVISAQYEGLLQIAKEAAGKSYSPYSKFPVGAALLASDGTIITGCNVENASFGATICAERTAFVKAVSQGITSFKAVAIYASEDEVLCWPCGICRQFMSEFGIELDVITQTKTGQTALLPLTELLPKHFGPADLHIEK